MNASLNEKLRAVKWGEYKLGDLFDSKNGNVDIQKEHINGKGEYVITSGLSNNGILGKTDIKANIFDSNTITVDMFGNAFYRNFKYKMVTHARVFSLNFKSVALPEKSGMFIASSFSFVSRHFGFDNMCTWDKIKEFKIKLPQTSDCSIDFDFMESFIAELEAELEAERIAELSAYLTVSGLDNYELSSAEENAIMDYGSKKFEAFDITAIFDVKNTSNILSCDVVENSGSVPYLCAGSKNNSVSSYIQYDDSFLEKGNCIFIGGKTFVLSYQKDDFFSNDSHNLALYLQEADVTKANQLYLATCVYKSLSHKYSWGNSISKAKIKTDNVFLPVKDGKPDYESMELLISAVQKLVIKDVVLYANQKIAATKEVVAKR